MILPITHAIKPATPAANNHETTIGNPKPPRKPVFAGLMDSIISTDGP